jgi:secondary thiamine-phosphate synthase enzyme
LTARLSIETQGKGLVECTAAVDEAVRATGVLQGVCVVFVQHTSASLTIQENADPSARRDIEAWLERTVREDDPAWTHVDEGPDDMPSHIRAMLTDVSLSIPIVDGQLALGTWQGIFLCEHRSVGHTRSVLVTVVPAAG